MKKHAYMIMAHNELYILEKLVELIDDNRNDIYVHIDKKVIDTSRIKNKLKQLVKYSRLIFADSRSVNWGGASQIRCEISLFKLVLLNQEEYSYCHLISGVDLPIKTQNYIHDFFDKNFGKQFVSFSSGEYVEKSKERWCYYRFLQEFKKRDKKTIISILEGIIVTFQRILGVDRSNKKWEYYIGANWISVQPYVLEYIVNNEKLVKKYFQFTHSCDEVYKQTLIMNSCIKNDIYNITSEGNMRYVDWKRGNPYIFDITNYKEIMDSKMMFARKCSTGTELQKELVDKIYHELST